jgi:outer membrane receptor protein involved in Fe transport
LQNPNLKGYAAYFQDDLSLTDRLTLNLGLRWEYEPGPTDPDNRLSQRIDLTDPIPEMQTNPPNMPAQAVDLMASKGYGYIYNGAWIFTSDDNPHAWNSTPWNFLPRVGLAYRLGDDSVMRAGYARYLRPSSSVRDTLGAFVEQYAGYAQVTNTLGLANGVPQQTLADPYPDDLNPVIEPYGQAYGRYTNLGGNANLDEYELRPQINDRFTVSYQKQLLGNTIGEVNYFFNWGSRVAFDKDLNMMDPAFRYEYKTLLNNRVPNPFRNYLTEEKFPGQLRSPSTVTLGSLLRPYPQYNQLIQRNTNGRNMRTHTLELRAQRPFTRGFSFLVAYAYNNEKRQEWFDDLAQYQIFTTGEGWEWRPTGTPSHRMTAALTLELPIGRGRKLWSDMPPALDFALGGWQYTATGRYYSGRLLLFTNSYIVDGDPKIDDPTRDRWFDTSLFHPADSFTPRSNPWYYDGLVGPSVFVSDMTLTKMFNFNSKYRLEARIEVYNAFNGIVWDNPDLDVASANFGKVTRKREAYNGREFQLGLRFIF